MSDISGHFLYRITPDLITGPDRLWARFYMRLTAPVTTIMKFSRFSNLSNNVRIGGFYLRNGTNILAWGSSDNENGAITTTIGLAEAQLLNNWRRIEVENWRNNCVTAENPLGWPSAAFKVDGVTQALPDGTPTEYFGVGSSAFWLSNRLYAGMRGSTDQIGWWEWFGTLNSGNTTTGQVNIDRLALSTLGWIGP